MWRVRSKGMYDVDVGTCKGGSETSYVLENIHFDIAINNQHRFQNLDSSHSTLPASTSLHTRSTSTHRQTRRAPTSARFSVYQTNHFIALE